MKFKKNEWFRKMSELAKLCLVSNLVLLPGIAILFFYEVIGVRLNVQLVYLLVDAGIVWAVGKQEGRRLGRQIAEEEEERSGRGILNIRQKIEELRRIGK